MGHVASGFVINKTCEKVSLFFSLDSTDKPSKGNQRAGTPGKAKGGQGRSSKDDKKTKEKYKQEEIVEGEEESTSPPPLTIQVQIKLHYWKSAREAAQEFLPQGIPSHTEQN